jgi:hypothetical protein
MYLYRACNENILIATRGKEYAHRPQIRPTRVRSAPAPPRPPSYATRLIIIPDHNIFHVARLLAPRNVVQQLSWPRVLIDIIL